jgi:transposase
MSNFCEESGLRLAPHPPYSPDLAASEFLLFGYVKERLKEWYFHHTRNDVTQLAKWLTAVFEHWMERLERVSENNGDYYP